MAKTEKDQTYFNPCFRSKTFNVLDEIYPPSSPPHTHMEDDYYPLKIWKRGGGGAVGGKEDLLANNYGHGSKNERGLTHCSL